MLKPPKFSHPDLLVDRLFDRITAIYGTQKATAMWSGLVRLDASVPEAETRAAWQRAMQGVKAVWAEALGNYHIDVIAKAIENIAFAGPEWPPNLPQFCQLCREMEEAIKPPQLLQLPNDASLADPESPAVRQAREELRQFINARRMPS